MYVLNIYAVSDITSKYVKPRLRVGQGDSERNTEIHSLYGRF